ncbi:hypothetical protein M407DRAFT_25362 [Tulasnella calospora MUT 4182]|uniref:Major facilitator superfamily (MFS) profile domain-containing protein n=1 Tax=Tulasnella calospora MUT 4182 TaxID=1051891 RepID=A0A0C3Q760_9AGAM|nr:hypothetical protein M407DRAFT_25362 [Tulasnella calospora MUT 4182]
MQRSDSITKSDESESNGIPVYPDPISTAQGVKATSRAKDFGILPIQKNQRWNESSVHEIPLFMNILLSFISMTTVANIYYCQPLTLIFAKEFKTNESVASTVPTLAQAGYAVGLLFITPLGDLVRRRGLLLAVLALSTLLTVGVTLSPSIIVLKALMFLLGAVSVTPQIIMPLVGDLAQPHRRCTVISIVLSGLLLGIIFARCVGAVIVFCSGSWKTVYWIGAGLQTFSFLLLWWFLPDWPSKANVVIGSSDNESLARSETYGSILRSMARLAVTEPILIQSCLIAFGTQMVFSSFWVTATLLLGALPYNFTTFQIGLFGLSGLLGVLVVPLAGYLIDRLLPWTGLLISILTLMSSQSLLTAVAKSHLVVPILGSFGLDLAQQIQQISSAGRIFA